MRGKNAYFVSPLCTKAKATSELSSLKFSFNIFLTESLKPIVDKFEIDQLKKILVFLNQKF